MFVLLSFGVFFSMICIGIEVRNVFMRFFVLKCVLKGEVLK